MKPLTREEFCRALRKGMGRAAAHLREHGSQGVEADILHACVNSLGYDPQCEGTRGEWLWRLLDSVGMKEVARPRILQALRDATAQSNTWTVSQLFVLAQLYAEQGDPEARQVIYDRFDQQFREDWQGRDEIVSLDGLDGLVRVARVLGGRLLREPGYWLDDFMLSGAIEKFGEEAVMAALGELANTDVNVRAFLGEMQRQKSNANQVQKEQPKSLHDVLLSIEEAKDRCIWLRRWGRKASREELSEVFRAMLKEDRPPQLLRYLRVFSIKPMPVLAAMVLQLAESDDEELRHASLEALSRVRDSKIREMAVRLLTKTQPELEAIQLFALNYVPGDHRFIESAIPVQAETDRIHGFGLDLTKVADEAKDSQLSNCLEWLYENGPCSECRYFVVRRLIDFGTAKAELLQECLLDCCDDTRKAAREALGLPADKDWATST